MFLLVFGLATLLAALGLGVYVLAAAPSATDAAAVVTDQVPVRAATGRDSAELSTLYRRMASLAAKLSRADYGQRLQRRLDLAGNPRNWEPERLLAFKGFGLVAGAAIGLLVGGKHGGLLVIAAPIALAAAGFFLPGVLVRNLGEKRQIDVRKGLPEALDMLTVCVEAGLGFDAALSRVARNLQGPMAEEFARVLQEMQFGKSRSQALRALVERTDVPELRSFVSAIVQSGELGITIGDVLREQAKEMRIKRRQRAEEKAQKLQVKLLLPLISCLLPAMFVVVLGPAVMALVHFFGTVNH